ncbi:MAG TPA: L-rhamnose mutarotase [Pararobbsia sp.]|nr:L-rhamnose mutarotase [Pararobbsia sp.]
MRYCLALDLKDDPQLIESYETYHREVWPEVVAHLRGQGVIGMEIYRLGTRMVMVMDTDDALYDADRMAAAAEADPAVRKWEELMWKFQAPTPWTPAGEKWVRMDRVFDLKTQA